MGEVLLIENIWVQKKNRKNQKFFYQVLIIQKVDKKKLS